MSLWLYGRKRGGRRSLWLVDTEPVLVLMTVALIVTVACVSLLNYPWIPFVLVFGGLACLIVSKTSLARGYANLGKIAYVLIGVGMFLMVLLWSKWRITS